MAWRLIRDRFSNCTVPLSSPWTLQVIKVHATSNKSTDTSERHSYRYCRNYCTGLQSRCCGWTAPIQSGYSPPNLLDRAKPNSCFFCNRIICKVAAIFPWRHPGSFTGHRMWAWRESGNRCPPSKKSCKKQTKEYNKNPICTISTSRAIINLESRSCFFFLSFLFWGGGSRHGLFNCKM